MNSEFVIAEGWAPPPHSHPSSNPLKLASPLSLRSAPPSDPTRDPDELTSTLFEPPTPVPRPPAYSNRYTRQEHLDRHITAKHRVAKDFVCPVCSKGFARKDILKRHQQGHEKQAAAAHEAALRGDLLDRDYDSSASTGTVKSKKKRVQSAAEVPVEDNGPVKIARVGRACCRCSKSKLRCDGQHPCERCRKAGIECSFERPGKSSSRAGSVNGMDDGMGLMTPSMESDSSATSPDNGFSMALPTPPPPDTWARPSGSGGQSGMSPYHVPLRQGSHPLMGGQGNFNMNQSPVNYYSGRSPDPYAYRANYQQPPAAFPNLQLPHHGPSPLNPFASSSILPPPPALAASTSSQWDSSTYARQIGDSGSTTGGQIDFLDVIASGAADQEIDWSVLNTGFAPQDALLQAAASAALPQANGSNSGNGSDIPVSLLPGMGASNANQPMSDLRGVPEEPSPASAAALVLAAAANGEDRSFSPAARSRTTGAGAKGSDGGEAPGSADRPTFNFRNHSLVESDNAAVSLLQLASHTPRVSPEPGVPLNKAVHGSAPRAGPSSGGRSGSAGLPNPPEEVLRTSHPSHTPSDPWPLSYRPTSPFEDILPKSARGTGYGSRAASPPPHHPHLSLAHVPSVTEATRLRILYKVRELTACDPSLSERFVPRLELLELFIQLYFDKYHSLYPLVHKPTWDPNTAPSFLVLAIASVGARYAWERVVGSSMHAHALLECSRRMAQIMSDLDITLLRTVAWQQTLLITLQSGMMSGNKRDLERSQAFASMPTTFARRQGWLKEPQVDEQAEELLPLDDRWKRWRDREEIRRLGFGAVVFDCTGTALWNMDSSSLYLDAAHTALPCHDTLWDAPTAQAWSAQFRTSVLPPKSPTLSHIVRMACSDAPLSATAAADLMSVSRDAFALSTVLSVLHSLGWDRVHARAVEGAFLATTEKESSDGLLKQEDVEPNVLIAADPSDGVRSALERGLDFFQDRILLPPDLLANIEQLNAASGNLALFVHLTALTQRLPLRVLQPLARSASAPSQASTAANALRAWARADDGAVARTTAYHAGQLIALCRPAHGNSGMSASAEGPLEPFALFYAALALVAFSRESHAGGTATPSDESQQEVALDILRDRSDPFLAAWIRSGPLTPPSGSATANNNKPPAAVGSVVPALKMLATMPATPSTMRLDSPQATERLLSRAADRLRELKVWKIGELLAGVLDELAQVESERNAVAAALVGGGAGAAEGAGDDADMKAGEALGLMVSGRGGGGIDAMDIDRQQQHQQQHAAQLGALYGLQ
ncbi:hypothetical protein B0A53_04762 [Rhodotorula sp. CCFEE 5036]|nr:hypothetical protein B0A53_04762 [Rhodotorula sp. CCFEE 5036]